MAINKTTIDSPMDDIAKSHDHRPILLSRSDTLPPCQAMTPPSSSAVTEIMDDSGDEDKKEATLSSQEKRKWDQMVDDSSQKIIREVAIHGKSIPTESSSIDDDEESQDSDDLFSSFLIGKKPGRKPLTDEDPSDDDDPKVKRKAQNRAAQRAFRERKERYVKELEIKLKQIQDAHTMTAAHLFQENHQLRSIAYRLETENAALKGIPLQHGPLSGKPVQEWVNAVQQPHQLLFATYAPFGSPIATATTSVYSYQPPQDLLCPSHLATAQHPLNTLANTGPTPPSNQQHQQKQQRQQPQKYTFSVSTPATLRSRHKKQHQSRTSPPLAPKPQISPVELVRLYPHEQSAIEPTTELSPTTIATETTNTHLSPLSPSSSTYVSSGAQTPTIFDDKVQEEGYGNAFDLLLPLEPFFNSTDRLDESLDFPQLDERSFIQQDHQASASPSSCSSSFFDTSHDYDSLDCPSTTIPSVHGILDGLGQLTSFEHDSSDQLLKSMANSTRVDPVLMEDSLG